MDQDKNEERGFQRIGTLMPMIEKSHVPMATPNNRLTGSQAASGTTGSASQGIEGASSIGKQLGETTSEGTSRGNKLAGLSPVVVDKMLRERLPPRVASLIVTAEILNNDFEVVGYKPLKVSPSEALAALEETDEFYHPAPYDAVIKGLARARAMTKRRTEQADDEEIALAAYAELFFPYPADVTGAVLARLHKLDGGWWPSALAVEKDLTSYGGGRLALRQALLAVPG